MFDHEQSRWKAFWCPCGSVHDIDWFVNLYIVYRRDHVCVESSSLLDHHHCAVYMCEWKVCELSKLFQTLPVKPILLLSQPYIIIQLKSCFPPDLSFVHGTPVSFTDAFKCAAKPGKYKRNLIYSITSALSCLNWPNESKCWIS